MIQNKTAAIIGITLISLVTFWTFFIPVFGLLAILLILDDD